MSIKEATVFIGATVEGLRIARAVQSDLDHDCNPVVWNQGVFDLSAGTLENLVSKLDDYDFAIIVLTADDIVETRNEKYNVPRDNLLFELGLFMGRLGRERTYMLYDRELKMKLPSDLAGITAATFRERQGRNLSQSIGTPCNDIRAAMTRLGLRSREWHHQSFGNRDELMAASGFMAYLENSTQFDLISFSANVLKNHQKSVSAALAGGARLRVLILDPGPETSYLYDSLAEYIGEIPSIKRNEAEQLSKFVAQLRENESGKGSIELRYMVNHQLPYNIWIAKSADGSECGHLTSYFHHRHGAGPSYRVRNPESSIMVTLRDEFTCIWNKSNDSPSS